MAINSTIDTEDAILIEQHAGWVEIIINRAARRNSIIPPVSVAILAALEAADADDSVQSVVLRGDGGYFCSGIDLAALQADPPPPWKDRFTETWRDLHLALFSFEKPVIGAFEKFGINAGAALALACDILITGETAFLQVGEIQQGVGMPMNAAWLKIKTTEQVAARLAFYGDRVSGPKLVELGLATECVADDAVVTRCREIAKTIGSYPSGASRAIKQTLISQREIDDPETYFKAGKGGSLLNATTIK